MYLCIYLFLRSYIYPTTFTFISYTLNALSMTFGCITNIGQSSKGIMDDNI